MSKVLVYGGNGALGSVVCKTFLEKQWTVFSVDAKANTNASHSITIDFSQDLEKQHNQINEELKSKLPAGEKLDSIINVAGGWAGGNVADDKLFSTTELMWKQSSYSSLIASRIASHSLKEGGLLVLTGAASSFGGTSFCVGYGMVKAAIHQLVASLAQSDSGLPTNAKAVAIAPVMLDTPGNRAGMPKADTSSWTPLSDLANELLSWASGSGSVTNGKVYKVVTADGKTKFE